MMRPSSRALIGMMLIALGVIAVAAIIAWNRIAKAEAVEHVSVRGVGSPAHLQSGFDGDGRRRVVLRRMEGMERC